MSNNFLLTSWPYFSFQNEKIEKNELQSVIVQRRSIRANQSLKKGTIIKESMLDYLRPWPKGSLKPSEKNKIINKR